MLTIFIIVLYFSKYGNILLGKPDDKDKFNDLTYVPIYNVVCDDFQRTIYPTVHTWYNDSADIVRILVVLHIGSQGFNMERDAALANITCDSKLGGTGSMVPYRVLHRLSCRGKNDMWFDVQ